MEELGRLLHKWGEGKISDLSSWYCHAFCVTQSCFTVPSADSLVQARTMDTLRELQSGSEGAYLGFSKK